MVILDTDCLTLIQRGYGEEFERLAARLDRASSSQPIRVTIISFEEQMRGWLAYIASRRTISDQVSGYTRLLSLAQDFEARDVLAFDDLAALRFEQLKRARVRIGTMDLKIASIVLVQEGILISRNLRDFSQVAGLQVEDWTAP